MEQHNIVWRKSQDRRLSFLKKRSSAGICRVDLDSVSGCRLYLILNQRAKIDGVNDVALNLI